MAVKEYWQQDGWFAAEDSVTNVEESVASVQKRHVFCKPHSLSLCGLMYSPAPYME